MNTLLLSMGTAAALGMSSSVHCATMCGPIAAVGTSVQGKFDKHLAFRYILGRFLGYSLLGAIAGAIAAPLTAGDSGEFVRLVLGLVVAGLLIYRAMMLVRPALGQRLVQLGRRSTRPRFFQILVRFVPRRGFGLGLATALFPCGALFAGIFAAASSGSAVSGAVMMAVFAAASIPLLMLPSFAAAKMGNQLHRPWLRKVGAVVLVAAAGWVVTPPIRSLLTPAGKPACCAHDAGV